eukprot:4810704-Prymnesium_polylepis.1
MCIRDRVEAAAAVAVVEAVAAVVEEEAAAVAGRGASFSFEVLVDHGTRTVAEFFKHKQPKKGAARKRWWQNPKQPLPRSVSGSARRAMASNEADEVNWLQKAFGRPSPGSPDGTVPLGVYVKFEVAADARALADEARRQKQERAELLRQRAIEQAAMIERRKQQ